MHDLVVRIDQVSAEIERLCGVSDLQALNFKLNPSAWSAAQVLRHIIAVNESYFPLFDALDNGWYRKPWTAHIPFLPGMFGRVILDSVRPENIKKTKTFPIWEPVYGNEDIKVVADFISHQQRLKEYLALMSDHLDKGTIINSPANKHIAYSLNDAFQIIVTHEERHLGQLRRALELVQRAI
jgi:hypothetical protein